MNLNARHVRVTSRNSIRWYRIMTAFELSKWYLDCVTDSGDASIAYTGMVHWGPVRLHYSSLLESTAGRVRTRHSLRPQIEPTIDHSSLRWRSGAFKIDAEWQTDSPEVRETIFASDAGSLEWHCLMPRAHARIHNRIGLGYVEHLTMTIAPWKLPIRTLRWGRFATPSDWIVWIDWLGQFSRRIVYWNGQIASTTLLEDGQIEFRDGARLMMDRSLVLREGPLGATALSVIPGVRDTFPAQLLQVNECKWRSRGRFERPGTSTVEAWAIHERVDWPK
ncbi:MAG: hypothetical protein LAP39_16200 [Acidobacteriia bacterium]|nr:hypothetical protein [Terriglobia bacterium]